MDIERIYIFVLFLVFGEMLSALHGSLLMVQKKTSYIRCPTRKLEQPHRAYESGLLGRFCVQRKGSFESLYNRALEQPVAC